MPRSFASRGFLAVGLLTATASLFAAPAVLAATGSDLGFGYTWRDSASGATSGRYTPSPLTSFNPANNGTPRGPVPLGMSGGFTFYGVNYTQAWISDNGWISFTAPVPASDSSPTPSDIPSAPGPSAMVAPLWKDLDGSDPAAHLLFYGSVPSIGGWAMTWRATDTVTGADVNVQAILFPDGRIQFQYVGLGAAGTATVGIEAAGATDGIAVVQSGVAQPGVSFTGDYVIEFFPPPLFRTECASVPARACGTISESLPGALPSNVQTYSCSATAFAARERAYAITIAQASSLDVTLTGAANLQAFVLDGCSERACIGGPGRNLSVPVWPGTYLVVVDAPAVADEGAFTLNVACTPLGTSAACGTTVSGTTIGGSALFGSYACQGTTTYDGTEAVYAVDVAAPTNLEATLTSGGANLDVFVLKAASGLIDGSDCVGWGDSRATAWNAAPGRYLVVVDSPAGSTGGFNLQLRCAIDMDCSRIMGTVDLGTARVVTVQGDNTAAANRVDAYACDPQSTYSGGEDVWVVTLPNPGMITVYPEIGNQNYFILSACNEGTCMGKPRCGTNLPAGTYYLVVDGATAGGGYEALVIYEEQFNRWSVCEDPSGGTLLTDTSSNFWNLTDEAFCITVPTSHNYPDGCTFAMYATVRCGTAMHLPLFDCEGGHMRVFDVLNGQYVDLTALSETGWFMTGTEIQWQDADCVEGSDPNWNEVVTDISFTRPTGLCGIFRLEFINHSGNVWELYANCIGDRTPGFEIHDSLCTALDNYLPVANISLLGATPVYSCPNVTITYTIRNDGCATVTNFPVQLFDDTTLVTTDFVPEIHAGETVVRTFTATFTTVPTTTSVHLVADANNVVPECDEVPGAGCNSLSGTDQIDIPGCSGSCQVVAGATASPTTICLGDSVTVDASSSVASLCGGALEYQLSGPTGTTPPQSSPIFTVSPTGTTTYTVTAACSADPSCLDSFALTITVERPPDLTGVRAADAAPCTLGIDVTWNPATFYGPGGTGLYNVYASDISCADALTRPPAIVGTALTTWTDPGTVDGTTYYYVVEAEDSTINSTCVPRGPRNGGAVTRMAANNGTCVGTLEQSTLTAASLPHVGGTLRAGGDFGDGTRRYSDTNVELQWGTDAPLNVAAGEHFHVYRTDARVSYVVPPWVALTTDSPRLTVPDFDDLTAGQPLVGTYIWFYLIYVANICEAQNDLTDGGNGGPP